MWLYRAESGDGPPWPGGFLAWPAYHYARYRTARAIRAALKSHDNATSSADWMNQHPDEARIVGIVQAGRIARQKRQG